MCADKFPLMAIWANLRVLLRQTTRTSKDSNQWEQKFVDQKPNLKKKHYRRTDRWTLSFLELLVTAKNLIVRITPVVETPCMPYPIIDTPNKKVLILLQLSQPNSTSTWKGSDKVFSWTTHHNPTPPIHLNCNGNSRLHRKLISVYVAWFWPN